MRKMIKKLSILLVLFLLTSCFSGCTIAVAATTVYLIGTEKKFSEEGMTITLTELFGEQEFPGKTGYYLSPIMGVLTLKEEFSSDSVSSEWNLENYAEQVIARNNFDVSYEISEDGYAFFEHEMTVAEVSYSYLTTCHKTEDSFWLIEFYTYTKAYGLLKNTMFTYASTIVFETEIGTEGL